MNEDREFTQASIFRSGLGCSLVDAIRNSAFSKARCRGIILSLKKLYSLFASNMHVLWPGDTFPQCLLLCFSLQREKPLSISNILWSCVQNSHFKAKRSILIKLPPGKDFASPPPFLLILLLPLQSSLPFVIVHASRYRMFLFSKS